MNIKFDHQVFDSSFEGNTPTQLETKKNILLPIGTLLESIIFLFLRWDIYFDFLEGYLNDTSIHSALTRPWDGRYSMNYSSAGLGNPIYMG